MVAKVTNKFWEWAKFSKNGVTYESDWVICRDGTLIDSRGNYASDTSRSGGYLSNRITLNGTSFTVRRHRIVARAFVYNPRPGLFFCVDHINGDRTDNRAENLRWVNDRLNNLNQTSRHVAKQKDCPKNPFVVRCGFFNTTYHIGCYTTEAEAIKVKNHTRKSLFEALYFYRTRPNTFLPPSEWKITPGCVKVI
jgi:hypothetical protein